MKVDEYYQKERYTKKWIKARKTNKYQYRLQNLIKKLDITFSGKVLDVGCGDGVMASNIKKLFPDVRMYGTDISKQGCMLAKKYCVEAKVADLNDKIPYRKDTFDYVIGQEIIEHLVDPDTFLEEAHRVLKPGGTLILTTPNLLSWFQRVLAIFGILPTFSELSTRHRRVGLGLLRSIIVNDQPVGHVRVFTKLGLEDLLEIYGFKIEVIKGQEMRHEFSSKVLTILYQNLELLFAHWPSLASDLIVKAKKET